MIDALSIAEIIATYQKYGWILRRVLLTKELKQALHGSSSDLFAGIDVCDSAIDAAWFSRPPQDGVVAWEIRYLGNFPFALLEKVDENDPKFDNVLSSIELRLRETISAKTSA